MSRTSRRQFAKTLAHHDLVAVPSRATSIQLNTAPANEPLLLNAAIHVQIATDHHTKTPPRFV